MSIYIGKTPISSAWSSVSSTASNSSTPLVLASDNKENFIQFQNFRLGQYKDNNIANFQLYHSNVLLTNYTSNLLQHNPNAIFLQNVAIQSDLHIGSNLTTRTTSTCNVTIYMKSGIPLRINSNNSTLFQIGLDGNMYFTSNLGIGITNPNYRLEIADSMRVQSNLIIGKTLDTSKVQTNIIYGIENTSTRIELNPNNIHLISPETIINNPSLVGNITYGATISLDQTTINSLITSNLRVVSNKANQQAVYIQQLNAGGFANTATGNPLHIESYFPTPNRNIPIFIVDTLGRISSGKTTATIPDPDYGYTYYIDKDRYPYLSGFVQYTSCNQMEQMIINKQGYISIGSNQTLYPLQIVNPYTGYESNIPRIESLIGLYQTGSNQYAYLQCYDCNQNVVLQITNTGKLLFQQQPQFDESYQLEIQNKGYIRRLDTSNIFSTEGINFINTSLSNIGRLETETLYAQSGVMSNVFFHSLSVDNIEIDAFDYVNKAPNYTEFRIIPDRFLFHGCNIVMNPNPYFFEVEQTELSKDNIRIYANGGPTQGINVIRTIGNNQQSQVRIYNCNDAVDSVSRALLLANQEGYTFGVINLSTTPNGEAEGFITNNGDLSSRNRQLSIHSGGIRVGESIHLLKDGTTTVGYKTPGKRTLNVVGEAEFKNNAGQTILFIKNNGNIGIGTDTPREGLEIKSQTAYLSGNLGIGNINPNYPVDVNGTVRATRVLGVFFDDVIGGSFSNVTPWLTSGRTSNIYYNVGNVGIGTNNPIIPFQLQSSNLNTQKHIEVGPIYYTLSWPPIGSDSTLFVNSNVLTPLSSNILAPFMPRYPPTYLYASTSTVSDTLYGNGIYTVKSSSIRSIYYNNYLAFEEGILNDTFWLTSLVSTRRYASDGTYVGQSSLNSISGEWIQLFCPNTFNLGSYSLNYPDTDSSTNGQGQTPPRSWTLLASNTSIGTWNILQTVTDGYIGSTANTSTYHLNIISPYDVYAIVVTKINTNVSSFIGAAISDIVFYENSNQRNINLGKYYNTYQLIGNTSNVITISSSTSTYNSGTYKVEMTSNYTQLPPISFNTSVIPYTITLTSNNYIQQSDLSGILNANSTALFTTLSNAFINTTDTSPPLSLYLTYPTITDPILTYSITGPSIFDYAPRKWTVIGSSDGTSWTQIDSRDNITWATNETKSFALSSPSTYSHYRYDFYRNNSAVYAPLSLKSILAYGTLRTDTPSLTYTTYPSTIVSYNQPPTSNLSQLSIIGGVVIGSNSMINNITPPNNSIIVDGGLGIGTTLPLRPLHIQGDTRITGNMSNEGRLYIGKNSGGNIGSGIYFGGINGDGSYDHTVIENRTYVVTADQQKSELLFFKGNDIDNTSNGPDRIRLRAGEIRFDVYPIDNTDRYTECNVVTFNSGGTMIVNDTLYTSNLMTSNLQSRVLGGNAFYQYTYYSAGNYILPTIPEYGCSQARIQMWGAGGGGAGGNGQSTINSAGTILGGGGGGGGGAYGEIILPSELLSNVTLTATIGIGGAYGEYGSIVSTITTTTNSTNATDGTAGTATTLTLTTNSSNSSFSYTWTVGGGSGGRTSITTTAGNLGAGGYPVTTANFTLSQKGGDGGLGGTTSTGGANGSALIGNGYSASGGGGGTGQPATNTTTALYYSGGNSGNASKIESYLIGTTAFAYGTKYATNGTLIQSGRNGYNILEIYTGGTGGGGGSGLTGNISGGYYGGGNNGFVGGIPGGGGGGGGTGRTIVPNNTTFANVYGSYGGYGADGGLILTYY